MIFPTIWKRLFAREGERPTGNPEVVAAGDGVVAVVGDLKEDTLTAKYFDGATPRTQSAFGISATFAGLRATVNPNGFAARAAFEFSTDSAFNRVQMSEPEAIGEGDNPVRVETSLFGLTPNTTYYLRAIGIVDGSVNRGETLSFKTAP